MALIHTSRLPTRTYPGSTFLPIQECLDRSSSRDIVLGAATPNATPEEAIANFSLTDSGLGGVFTGLALNPTKISSIIGVVKV
jgi:hypothetical protein